MPFPYDDDNPIVSGLLAGMKFRALDEDLKISRLQRLEFEQTAQHRENLRTLEEQLGQTRLLREQLGVGISEIERQMLKFQQQAQVEDRPLEQSLLRSRSSQARTEARTAKLNLRSAREDRGYVRKSQDLALRRSENDLRRSQLEAELISAETQAFKEDRPLVRGQLEAQAGLSRLSMLTQQLSLGEGAGRAAASTNPTVADAAAIVAGLGVKDDSAKGIMVSAILSGAEEKRREIEQNKLILDQHRVEQQRHVADLIANAAARGRGYVEALGEVLPGGRQNPVYVGAKETLDRGGLPETGRTMTPGQIEEDRALGKALGELRAEIITKRANVEKLKKARESSTVVGEFARKVLEGPTINYQLREATAELEAAERSLAELEATRGASRSTRVLSDTELSSVLQSLGGIDPSANDDTLSQLADYLRARGIETTVAQLKKLQKSK